MGCWCEHLSSVTVTFQLRIPSCFSVLSPLRIPLRFASRVPGAADLEGLSALRSRALLIDRRFCDGRGVKSVLVLMHKGT